MFCKLLNVIEISDSRDNSPSNERQAFRPCLRPVGGDLCGEGLGLHFKQPCHVRLHADHWCASSPTMSLSTPSFSGLTLKSSRKSPLPLPPPPVWGMCADGGLCHPPWSLYLILAHHVPPTSLPFRGGAPRNLTSNACCSARRWANGFSAKYIWGVTLTIPQRKGSLGYRGRWEIQWTQTSFRLPCLRKQAVEDGGEGRRPRSWTAHPLGDLSPPRT